MRRLSRLVGLVLSASACVQDPGTVAGQAGGPCLQGACFGDLVCDAGVCVDPDGGSTDVTTGGPPGESASTLETSGTLDVSSGATSPTSADASTSPEESTRGDDDPGTTSGQPESESSEPTSSTTPPDDTSGGSGVASESGEQDVCASDPGDDACIECTKGQCCDEVEACVADDGPGGCACAHDCVIEGGDFVTCLVGCDLYPPPAGSPVVPLGECMLEQCPSCSA